MQKLHEQEGVEPGNQKPWTRKKEHGLAQTDGWMRKVGILRRRILKEVTSSAKADELAMNRDGSP